MLRPTLWQRLLEVFAVFAKLGAISFGGPAAHIALMERELVQKRAWIDRQTFLDLNSISQLIPGPNSTELAIHIGYRRAGWAGLVVAGISFVLPAMLIVTLLAFVYEQYAMLPFMQYMMAGIKPVVVAIIAHAVWLLGKSAIKNQALFLLTICSFVAMWFGLHELLTIALAGVIYLIWEQRSTIRTRFFSSPLAASALLISAATDTLTRSGEAAGAPLQQVDGMTLSQMFWTFLKIGAVLYGSGYVLIAYLQTDFVERFGALSPQQLLDAITIGQFTPGPLFTTATFIGYMLHGFDGAWLATVAIFLPAFLFVALVAPWVSRLRGNRFIATTLDAINCASLAFIALIATTLCADLAGNIWQPLLAIITLLLLLRYSWNSAWLVLGGAAIGAGSFLLTSL
jgi:chromate transporter